VHQSLLLVAVVLVTGAVTTVKLVVLVVAVLELTVALKV
jgi:hypothetical protein